MRLRSFSGAQFHGNDISVVLFSVDQVDRINYVIKNNGTKLILKYIYLCCM